MLSGQIPCVCGKGYFPAQRWQHVNCKAPLVPAVNSAETSAVNRRGAYPNTDSRREYMRQKMAARRAAAKGGV